MESKLPKWQYFLRWVAVLPVAVAASAIGHAIVIALYLLSQFVGEGRIDPSSWPAFVGKVLASAVSGFAPVIAAFIIAPSHKAYATLSVALLFLLASGYVLFGHLFSKSYGEALLIAVSVGGAVYALIIVKKDSHFRLSDAES
jgi:hypothetical protein